MILLKNDTINVLTILRHFSFSKFKLLIFIFIQIEKKTQTKQKLKINFSIKFSEMEGKKILSAL